MPVDRLNEIMADIGIVKASTQSNLPVGINLPVGMAPRPALKLPVGMTIETLRNQEEKLATKLRDYTELEVRKKSGGKLNSVEVCVNI